MAKLVLRWNDAKLAALVRAHPAAAAAGKYVEERAGQLAPHRTGRLQQSIDSEVDKLTGTVRIKAIFYAGFLERPARQLHYARKFLSRAVTELRGRRF